MLNHFTRSKWSILTLVLLMLAVIALGRVVKVSQEKQQIETWATNQLELIQKQNNDLKKERDLLKKETSRPLRDRIISEIQSVFGSKSSQAIKVAQCESGLNPTHINSNKRDGVVVSRDYSIFQVNSLWVKLFGDKFMTDYKENVRVAKAIYDRSGDWRHWSASVKCHGLVAKI